MMYPYPPPYLTTTPRVPPVYGPPVPPEPEIPWFLQCGRCGEPVQGKTPRAPTPVDTHRCDGPYPIHMDFPCPGPFFDAAAPIGLHDFCCICLRPCEIDDVERMRTITDPITGISVFYNRNNDQLHWTHEIG